MGTPSTTSEYIWMKRRYESYAKRALPLWRASATTVRSFSPRFRIVSIIPGIETGAPDRTETSNGFDVSPNPRPVASSRRRTFVSTSARNSGEIVRVRK
jgi:hypothetical protein